MRNSQWEKVWSCETQRAYPNIRTQKVVMVQKKQTVNSHLSFWWPFERALIHVGRYLVLLRFDENLVHMIILIW